MKGQTAADFLHRKQRDNHRIPPPNIHGNLASQEPEQPAQETMPRHGKPTSRRNQNTQHRRQEGTGNQPARGTQTASTRDKRARHGKPTSRRNPNSQHRRQGARHGKPTNRRKPRRQKRGEETQVHSNKSFNNELELKAYLYDLMS
ncbi:hypothetical protein MA16_Dca019452 [Dendrobium catenatum]|uniref:Uncharacterized protein n=1 Tax=Dendrobium catenatum TaxID=906689 RepID=A0A2I0WHD6_9ASPA|nr:hypothetical protein MA16_Dca019452 [Dendrobium catenatum]